MISNVDIEAFKEDQEYNAKNQTGWEVQALHYTLGWLKVVGTFARRGEAEDLVTRLQKDYPFAEFRVYASLK